MRGVWVSLKGEVRRSFSQVGATQQQPEWADGRTPELSPREAMQPEWIGNKRPEQDGDILVCVSVPGWPPDQTTRPTLWHLERKCSRIQPIQGKLGGGGDFEITANKFLLFWPSEVKYEFSC